MKALALDADEVPRHYLIVIKDGAGVTVEDHVTVILPHEVPALTLRLIDGANQVYGVDSKVNIYPA